MTKPAADSRVAESPPAAAPDADVAALLRRLPPAERGRLVQMEFFSGPLPPPEVLARYAETDAEIPRRLIALVDREQRHNHQIIERGQIFCFAVALAALLGGVVLLALDRVVAGGVLAGTPLIGIAAAYLRAEFRARKNGE